MEIGLINNLTLLNDDIRNLLLDDTLSKQLIISFTHTKFTATALVSGKFVSIEEYSFIIEEDLDTELIFERTLHVSQLLEYNYNKIIYISKNQYATYVPKEIYAAEIRNAYLNLTHKEFLNKDIISKTIMDKEVVFNLPLKFIDAILQKSPTAEIAHYSEYFIANKQANTLFINKLENRIDTIVFDEDKKLNLYNSYKVNNEVDIEYYINLIIAKNSSINNIQCLSKISESPIEINHLIITKPTINESKIHSLADKHLTNYFNENPLLFKIALFYANN